MEWIKAIFGALDPVKAITEAIVKYKIAAANAATDQERIHAEESIKALEAKRDVLVAESSRSSVNAIMRFLLALGPMVYLNKIFLWDKVLELGSTDPLSKELWYVAMTVIGFYFLSDAARAFKK